MNTIAEILSRDIQSLATYVDYAEGKNPIDFTMFAKQSDVNNLTNRVKALEEASGGGGEEPTGEEITVKFYVENPNIQSDFLGEFSGEAPLTLTVEQLQQFKGIDTGITTQTGWMDFDTQSICPINEPHTFNTSCRFIRYYDYAANV